MLLGLMLASGDHVGALVEGGRGRGATLAQDEASCVVYGMPKEAVRKGAVERSVALADIACELCTR